MRNLHISSALGLKYPQEHSIIHRDIKVENILLLNNVSKLSNFSILIKLSEKQNTDAHFVCSSYGTAPEVISMEPINEKCDIWSIGITAPRAKSGISNCPEVPQFPGVFGEQQLQ
jgi:serine/threonine protein kinase